jgi:hypothetical protein
MQNARQLSHAPPELRLPRLILPPEFLRAPAVQCTA